MTNNVILEHVHGLHINRQYSALTMVIFLFVSCVNFAATARAKLTCSTQPCLAIGTRQFYPALQVEYGHQVIFKINIIQRQGQSFRNSATEAEKKSNQHLVSLTRCRSL